MVFESSANLIPGFVLSKLDLVPGDNCRYFFLDSPRERASDLRQHLKICSRFPILLGSTHYRTNKQEHTFEQRLSTLAGLLPSSVDVIKQLLSSANQNFLSPSRGRVLLRLENQTRVVKRRFLHPGYFFLVARFVNQQMNLSAFFVQEKPGSEISMVLQCLIGNQLIAQDLQKACCLRSCNTFRCFSSG